MAKTKLHPRNKHIENYDFKELLVVCPELKEYVKDNVHGGETIDFANAEAVKLLNKALLMRYYSIDFWDIPSENLCPPIPGRADYIHYAADLLSSFYFGKVPKGPEIKVLDIGIGANCIYPILGQREYGWSFVGSEIDSKSIEAAKQIIDKNEGLAEVIEIRKQENDRDIFQGIIERGEKFQLSICNPPFHSSVEEANKGTQRKLTNLSRKRVGEVKKNFSGKSNELIYEGGEKKFIQNMIHQSFKYRHSVDWFTTLVSKEAYLKSFNALLDKLGATQVRTIPMGTGNKVSRILGWTFLEPKAVMKKKMKKL
jgi:23S rRNA (adenine1618-N6)-methyltransferase|tara:strand:- start:45073 stop:46008 length:936 start_codon:yes stop_codon:yes gene_type:complete